MKKRHAKEPLRFPCGIEMNNRFMLAPLTNTQSHEDGTLSEDEYRWLTMRAKGNFGLVMTCASHVQEIGKGFSGQLGIFSDAHIKGHKKLVKGIKKHGSLAVIQLHHAGMRSPATIINDQPICPSENEEYGARALSIEEVFQLRDDFVNAALRAKKCGYDGVEVHGAHGYILTQFISKEINKRTDRYGGNLENRTRLLYEIIHGIRNGCGEEFIIGVRLSPERFGMDLHEVKEICTQLDREGTIDFLDISLWDTFKMPEDEQYKDQSLLDHFTNLSFKKALLTVAGKIKSGHDVNKVLERGVDFVTIGRSAILHHDFPLRVLEDPGFTPKELPVSSRYLGHEGLGKNFIDYLRKRQGFVE